jgi:hypothetical protein
VCECAGFCGLELEPVLALQLLRVDHSEGSRCARAVDLLPEHESRVVAAVCERARRGHDVGRPDLTELGEERGHSLRPGSHEPLMTIADLHLD